MPRGGRRSGTPGKAYKQRTDLHAVPATAATGQAYGEAKAQMDSQKVVPIANGALGAAGAGATPVPASPAAPPQATPPPVAGLPAGLPAPGSMPPLDAPTDRPDEHLMTGVGAGPGPGPEALAPMVIHPLVSAAGILNALGDAASPQVRTVRDVINAQLSNQATP